MKKSLVLPFLLFFSPIYSQEKIPFVDFAEISSLAAETSQNAEYEKTLEMFNRIHKSDSAYYDAMVSKSYYLMALKKYDEAESIIDKGLEADCGDLRSSFYINKVVVLLNQEMYEEAIGICEEGIKLFPMNKTLWYNKGVSLEKMEKIKEASSAYQKTILLDPTYRKAYMQLGNICYKQELISQALMCFNMYLLLEPDAENAFSVLKSLNNVVKSKNENTKNSEIKISLDDDSFEEIDLILNNKIALNERYQIGNEIDVALTRQNHALIHSLNEFSGNGGFWDTKFVPFYKWIINNEYFDVFSYTISYSIENETFKKVIEKKENEIIDFLGLAKNKWLEILRNNTVEHKEDEEKYTYFFKDGYVQGRGKIEDGALVGPWDLFNSEGRLSGKGVFNAKGDRDGDWVWYNGQGKVKEKARYIDGKMNGPNYHYYDDGRQKIVSNYKDDNLVGEYLFYNTNGALQERKHFKDGKLHGLFNSYHDVGEEILESQAEYVNGNIGEIYHEYFPTGKVSAEINFKDGKAHGQETRMHLNGELSLDLNSENGFARGYYKKFYSNGNLQELGQTLDGNYVGYWKTFYSNNTLESDFNYNNNSELNGEYNYYDKDGKIHYIFEYRKGEFIAYKYYDKEGNVIDENRKKGGEFYYKGFSPYGKIASEGLYDIKGGKKGIWKYYTSHGVLTDEGRYEDNKLQGDYKTYYAHGEIESISNYKNDTLNGYYAHYHKNGKLSRQGWYKDNNLHGEWRSYTPNGKITQKNFYHKGQFHGEQILFSGNGVKTLLSTYNYGNQIRDIYYDVKGNVSYTINYQNNETKYELVYQHSNKKPSVRLAYVNGVKHGPYSFSDFYGRKVSEGQYLNGKLHKKLVWYHENGNIETESNYLYGELEGDYIDYFEDGSMEIKYHYVLGKLHGEAVTYHENGNIKSKDEYHFNQRNGRRESYGVSGNLQLVRFYEHGRLIGYSYLDDNSKELPMIPIEHETAKIVSYYDNGKISRELEYKDGYLHNVYKEYFYSGQLKEQIYYDKREIDGKRIEYFANGTIKRERLYELGNLNGIVKEYFENGQLKKEETYLHDTKEGITRKYLKNGKLIVEETYFNDDILSSTSK